MNEQKILDLAKPILRTWSSESNLESIALLQEDAMEWMFDNYINLMGSWNYQRKSSQLVFIPRNFPITVDVTLSVWARCPFINSFFVSHNYIRRKYKNILEYIMYAIEEGYYVFLNMNQENLSTRMGAKIHRTFIYGFDENKRILYVADHYNHRKYALAELGFDEFLKAYEFTYWDNNGDNLIQSDKLLIRETQMFTIAKQRPFKYEFNLEWVKMQLKDYLNATYTLHCVAALGEVEGVKRYWGISSYNLAVDHLDELIKNEKECSKDWKTFTLICDHKKLLKLRMEFFRDRGICSISDEEMDKYDMLYRTSEIVLKLFLKYRVSGNVKPLKKMQDMLMEMKEVEYELLSELQKKL